MTSTEILRKQVKKYIDKADENSLRRVNAILEIDQKSTEWWHNTEFTQDLDNRYKALVSGEDKGVTLEQLQISIDKRKQRKRGK